MKTIKFLSKCVMALMVVFAFSSCTKTLEQQVADMNKKLPMTEGDYVFTRVAVEGDFLVFYADCIEKEVSYDDPNFKLEWEILSQDEKNELFKEGAAQGEGFKELTDLCKKYNKGLRFITKGKKSGITLKFVELKSSEL